MSDSIADIKRIFSSVLPGSPDFELRPQQEEMALAIGQALEAQTHLIVEAPTGIGKTLAYLIPAVIYARSQGRKAVISTHTKNLQEQLICKDIPLVRSLLDVEFKAVTLKGRRNYLCTTRLATALGSTGHLFGDDVSEELRRIKEWSLVTVDGDVDSLGFVPSAEAWELVCSEPDICGVKPCGQRCFFQRVKERARDADVVVVNHALFFTLLALQDSEERFLFENDFVVFDEAHTLETVAASGIGRKFSRGQLFAALARVRALAGRKRSSAAKNLRSLCRSTEEEAETFFDTVRMVALGRAATDAARGSRARELRIRSPHLVENTLSSPLAHLRDALRAMEEEAEGGIVQELAALDHRLMDMEAALDDFLLQETAGFTYWVEAPDARGQQVSLCSSPWNVGEIIGPRLFRNGTSVIMTSATLAVNRDLDYFRTRVGATGVASLVLDSPFDHSQQMRLCVARDIPEPDTAGYLDALPQWILRGIDRSSGKALVLFTNASLMRSVAASLAPAIEQRGWKLLVQGPEQQRHVLLEAFRRDVHSVLFGLDSFWMGVDVPGEALEHVIITRLPFAVPNHPLIEARLEAIARQGGNAFFDYTLPEAVLKFRQGAGRLLRSRFDTGVVTLLDSRVLKKSYGRTFLCSLPRCPIELISSDGEIEFVEPSW